MARTQELGEEPMREYYLLAHLILHSPNFLIQLRTIFPGTAAAHRELSALVHNQDNVLRKVHRPI